MESKLYFDRRVHSSTPMVRADDIKARYRLGLDDLAQKP